VQPKDETKNDAQHDADQPDGRVLAVEIGLRAFLDGAGNFLHPGGPGTGRKHLPAGVNAVGKGS
jgi:hypothetical protein